VRVGKILIIQREENGQADRRNQMTIKEQEEFIDTLATKFRVIADENMIPISFRAARMFAMVSNTELQKLLNERKSNERSIDLSR